MSCAVTFLLGLSVAMQATLPASDGPDAALSRFTDLLIAGDADGAVRMLVSGESITNQSRQDALRKAVAAGHYKDASASIIESHTQGNMALVELAWEYRGRRAWDRRYLVRRDGSWRVLDENHPTLVDFDVAANERAAFRALVAAHTPRLESRLATALPNAGSPSPREAAVRFQSAVNAKDAGAVWDLSIATTLRHIDTTFARIDSIDRGEYPVGEQVIEVAHAEGPAAAVIFRVRTPDGLSRRQTIRLIQMGDGWYLWTGAPFGEYPRTVAVALGRIGTWALEWELRPATRGPAPSPELAAIWAEEEMPHAAAEGNLQRVNELLQRGAPASSQMVDVALQSSQFATADRLIRAGADPAGPGRETASMLGGLIERGKGDEALWLLQQAPGSWKPQSLSTPLYAAAARADVPLVGALLAAGADPNLKPAHGVPILIAAVGTISPEPDTIQRHLDVLDILLAAKADPLARATETGASILDAACGMRGHIAIVRRLLALRVFDQLAMEKAFRTNLYHPRVDVLAALLEAGAGIDAMDRQQGLLFTPIYGENPAIVQWLLDRGASVNATNADETVLHAAVRLSDATTVKKLLDRGADATQKDSGGRTVFDLIARRNATQPSLDSELIQMVLDEWRVNRNAGPSR